MTTGDGNASPSMHHRMGFERMCALKIPGLSRDRSGRDGCRGILSIMMVFQSILPPYILSGELPQVSFDPDLEEVHQKLDVLRNQPIEGIMKTNPPNGFI